MNEKVLHFIWKYQLFSSKSLVTSQKELLVINNAGLHNVNAGPDFLNATVRINEQLWVGNVEIHQKSSDWYLHNHHLDENYKAVILHVVWDHDREVFNTSDQHIPVLELSKFVDANFLRKYEAFNLMQPKWILCENELKNINFFTRQYWMEKLFFERLERKTIEINKYLEVAKNDWESVLFILLSKNFGAKINGEAFLQLALSIDYQIIRKEKNRLISIEALLFGQAGFLENNYEDAYFLKLQKEYHYLKIKYKLKSLPINIFHFFRLRPLNFPTIRLAQLTVLLSTSSSLFSQLINAKSKDDIYSLFKTQTSPYWETHYTFGMTSKDQKKTISKAFIDTLIINTIIPLKSAYYKRQGMDLNDNLLEMMQSIKPEKNAVIKRFSEFGSESKNAIDSQALLQLKNEYCNYKRCLDCSIGNEILGKLT